MDVSRMSRSRCSTPIWVRPTGHGQWTSLSVCVKQGLRAYLFCLHGTNLGGHVGKDLARGQAVVLGLFNALVGLDGKLLLLRLGVDEDKDGAKKGER